MGWIEPTEALGLCLFALIGMIIVGATLGKIPLTILSLGAATGLIYDLWLKSTVLSGLMYGMAMPLIPMLAWVVFGRWQPFLPWIVPLGAALGVAMNVANTLPDLELDCVAGVRGLPHLLGMRWGLAICWGVPLLCAAVVWMLDVIGAVPAHPVGLVVATLAACGSTVLAALRYARAPSPRVLRTNFYLQAYGVVVLAIGWMIAVALK
jgi:4-hydroxybenzoate polyprenyltransferase